MQCPCRSKKDYQHCCGKFISGQQIPSTPEELMRSRYTAYSEVNISYIECTMKARAVAGFDPESARQWAKAAKWHKLEVKKSYFDPQNQNVGFVEFKAYYFLQHQKQVIHELSEFHFEGGRWYYVDGKQFNR